MRLSVKNLVFFFAVVFSCPSGFPSPSSPSSIFRFLIREKETTIRKKDSGEEEEKTTMTREWGIALVCLQDLPLLQLQHRKSRSLDVKDQRQRDDHREAVEPQQQHDPGGVLRQRHQRREGVLGGEDPGGAQPSCLYLRRAPELH
ncbi:uncharacterized protein LOC122006070 [Zingiber officinale]|uniref:uncharacterized protein LOC122006070 n=1 Tax=Zingiber officinale TaxID=94328 RepID=UPI001C4D4ADD|nr:uncharacterized protein LOC122006070 [Zingiber officinale]